MARRVRARRLWARDLEAGQRQVWIELALFARKTQFLHLLLDSPGESRQVRRRFDSGPHHARAAGAREKANAFDLDRKGFHRPKTRKRLRHLLHRGVLNFTQKFQREMNSFGMSPADAGISVRFGEGVTEIRLLLAQRGANAFRQVDGDEGSHLEDSGKWFVASIAFSNQLSALSKRTPGGGVC